MATETAQPQQDATAKRVLVIDADVRAWEARAKLLIAKGYLIHRVSTLADAPHQWPMHLYDLVIVAVTGDLAAIRSFCQELKKANPHVKVALLASQAAAAETAEFLADARISSEGTAVQFADAVEELLSRG